MKLVLQSLASGFLTMILLGLFLGGDITELGVTIVVLIGLMAFLCPGLYAFDKFINDNKNDDVKKN